MINMKYVINPVWVASVSSRLLVMVSFQSLMMCYRFKLLSWMCEEA